MPPRTAWGASPLSNEVSQHPPRPGLSPIEASPNSASNAHHKRTGSENYYEDVDPRFANDEAIPSISNAPASPVPNSLMPGGAPYANGPNRHPSPQHLHPHAMYLGTNSGSDPSLERNSSYENMADGARSPAGSDASHFTSVSQRGVNPNWRPPPGMGYSGPGSGPQQRGPRKDEVILGANPDFSLPGMRAGRGGMRGGGAMRSASGLTPAGRYPGEI